MGTLTDRTDWRTKLSVFRQLRRGWNGYDAPPPSDAAYRAAVRFLDAAEGANLLPDRLAPSAVGGLGLTYRGAPTRAHAVYVELYNDGRAAMLAADGESEPRATGFEPGAEVFTIVAAEVAKMRG